MLATLPVVSYGQDGHTMAVDQYQLEFRTVVLAALLHDIGKLLQRGEFGALDVKGPHPTVSADFISAFRESFADVADVDLLRTLVQHHHENDRQFAPELLVQTIADPHVRSLAALVSQADNLSSSERGVRSEQWQDFKFTPLAPSLARLARPGAKAPADSGHRLHASPLVGPAQEQLVRVFPEEFKEYESGEFNRLLLAFGAQFRRVAEHGERLEFDALVSHLLSVLFTHATMIPSNTQEAYPDVSLFDHLRGTAAIAACMYKYHASDQSLAEAAIRDGTRERFLLVGGDLTGIQRYIFGIANEGAGGIARRLRARSMFVEVLAEAAALAILRETEMPLTNVLMTAGGRFYLLLPNLPEVTEGVERVARALDGWLLSELQAAIGLVLAGHPFGDDGFKPTRDGKTGFGGTLRRVNGDLALKKAQPLTHALQSGDRWDEERFLIPAPAAGSSSCPACRLFPVEEAEGVCRQCERDRELGARLPRATHLELAPEGQGWPVFDRILRVWDGRRPRATRDGGHVWVLNEEGASSALPLPARVKYLARHVPQSGETLLTFQDIARLATGKSMLGFLKADADRMGELIAFGLRRDAPESDLDTISRVIGVSRSLDLFFTGWVEHLLETEFRDCYAVYSGGDDLFVVGPWDQTLRLAEKAREDFARYTANPGMTLSAGVLVADPAYPISRAAEEAEGALARAKSDGRNRLALFGQTMTWEDWRRVRELWDLLVASGEASAASGRFLHHLRGYGDMWRRYVDGDSLALRFQPRLAYDAARNLDRRGTPELARLVARLLSIRPKDDPDRWMLDHLSILAELLILSTRKEATP